MVNGCRGLLVARINKKYAPAGSKTGTDKPPKIYETLWRNMRKPKPEKHGIELLGRLPLKLVCLNIANNRGAESRGIDGQHLCRTVERSQVRCEGK